jgi:excisionase family DNA binding protein
MFAVSDIPRPPRFLTVDQVAEELNVSAVQVRALLKSGDLRGIPVGGRGLWRIGATDVEDYIAEAYRRTAERIASGDLGAADEIEPS